MSPLPSDVPGQRAYDDAVFLLSSPAATAQDCDAALHLLKTAAQAGHGGAMLMLGDIYLRGQIAGREVMPADLPQAAEFYKQAIKAGADDALFGLGVACKLLHDYARAAACFHESAYRFGRRESLREYGICTYMGQGVPANRDKGRELIRRAALMDPEFSELGRRYLSENFGIDLPLPDAAEREERRRQRDLWRDSRRARADNWREE